MKQIRKIGLLLLAVLLIVPFMDVDAQKRKRKKPNDAPKEVKSFIDIYGGAGYSSFMHKIDGTSVPGGGAGMIGFGYFMKHKSNFNFRGGLEFMYLNSATLLDPKNYTDDYLYSDVNLSNHKMLFNMDLTDYKEQQNRLALNIPIMFGGEFNAAYFLIGAKVGIGMMNNYSAKSNVTTFMEDDHLIDNLENMPTHDLETFQLKHKGNLKLGLDVIASAELGLCIDEWMPAKAREMGEGVTRRDISYRVGLFADYGVLNINKNTTTDILLNSDNMQVNGNEITMPAGDIANLKPRSVFNTSEAASKAVNSFVIGAKFTVLFGIDKAPKPQPKRKLRRPVIRELTYIPDPTYLYLYVSDYETQEPLDAIVKVYNLGENTDTIFAGMTDKETGFVEEQIDNGRYGLFVSRPGYIDFNDTLFNVVSDTLYVDLQPIKKNTVVILRNLLFDTDKTTIRNISAPSLEEMYQLLAQNPNMRIRITGHTDNVGSERYNKKLSEGRAKAVYDEMVNRGIDPSRMEWNGRGSKEPIESNKTAEGRAENRRVEFTILSE